MASLRFCDTADVSELVLTDSAVCGTSINHKGKNGAEMVCATPSAGFVSQGDWARTPLFRAWKAVKSKKRAHASLFPHVDKDWDLDFSLGPHPVWYKLRL